MRLFIRHETTYSFTQPQSRLVQLLRVSPGTFAGQNVIGWQIDVDCDARLKSGRDGHGNETTMLYIKGPVERIRIAVTGEVLTDDRAGMVAGSVEPLPPVLYTRPSALAQATPEIAAFTADAIAARGNLLGGMHELMKRLHDQVAFDAGPVPDVTRTAGDAFAKATGVCQDFAHIMIAGARSAGLPARYVSGHLYRTDRPGPERATHAWAEVHVPKYGWIGFDPANDRCPDGAYIRVATGLDYEEAAPLRGARVGGGDEWLEVAVTVSADGPVP